jgi:DTW domain-containing protein YfiP
MREVCSSCGRPRVVCICAHIHPLATRTRVVVLQHPRESEVPINTIRIARLVIPSMQCLVGVEFENDRRLESALSDEMHPPVLLFPGAEARDLRADPPPHPVSLVLVDGTWSQAARIVRRNPRLRALPQYAFVPSAPSNYRIRREPEANFVASIEALAEVLTLLEPPGFDPAPLLAPFRAMVDMQLEFAARFAGTHSRHARIKRPPRPRPIPPEIRDRPEDIVLAYGEANAWPATTRDPPPPEIVHWVAIRPSTGETFDAIVKPRHPLAIGTHLHVELARDALLRGESFESFATRWCAFVRPTDVVFTWGHYAAEVLASEGIELPNRVDLHRAVALHLGEKTGVVESTPARLGIREGVPWSPGRAGRRIAAMAAVHGYLAERARIVAQR